VLWRTAPLEEAGFSRQLAATLARDRAYDLHAVLELVERGCPPELASRILAPLDHDARALTGAASAPAAAVDTPAPRRASLDTESQAWMERLTA